MTVGLIYCNICMYIYIYGFIWHHSVTDCDPHRTSGGVKTSEQFVYVGESKGSWSQTASMQWMGAGQCGQPMTARQVKLFDC